MSNTTRAVLLGLALAASVATSAGCDNTVATPAGTEVLSYTSASLSVSGWSIGAPVGDQTSDKAVYLWESEFGPPVRFELNVTRGPVAFIGDSPGASAPATILAPSLVKVSVVENTGWAVTASCTPALAVPLAVNPDGSSAIPASVWAECTIKSVRNNGNSTVSIHVDAHGDRAAEVKALAGTLTKGG